MLLQQDDSDANYSNEALKQILEGIDAKIDDEELFGAKKSLLQKANPISLINQL